MENFCLKTLYHVVPNYSVIGYCMKRVYTCFISMAITRSKSFETKQKSKSKVYVNFIFISIEKGILENLGSNQNSIAHVL